MIYFDFSCSQLKCMADSLNRRYDESRLTQLKQVDVYDIVDLLQARIAFEYLSPDRTYLGATLFRPGSIWVWPGNPYVPGMLPTEKLFYGGTIIVDRDLNESKTEEDHFVENFTVMHECFHFDKHPPCFKHSGHLSKSLSTYGRDQANYGSALYKIERQADYAAAAFLMPRQAVIYAAKELLGYTGKTLPLDYSNKHIIKEIGRLFGVNYSPMLYRLQELKIISRPNDLYQ